MAEADHGQRNTFTQPHNADGQGFYGNDFRNIQNAYFTAGSYATAKGALLRRLGPTNPEDERERILKDKDKLLEGSCSWVFEQDAFKTWWAGEAQAKIFWIHGEPGKGKTMIMSDATNTISRLLSKRADGGLLGYFFCQQQDPRLNNATAVLKGLLYCLVSECDMIADSLHRFVSDSSDGGQETLSFWTLKNWLKKVLQLETLPSLYLLVDALDECSTGLQELLDLIDSFKTHKKVRWLISSRNDARVREQLETDSKGVRTSLEVNSTHVSAAVHEFIRVKVETLSRQKGYSSELKAEVRDHLTSNAGNTFLWVALACKELHRRRAGKAKKTLMLFPPGLEALYERMLTQVDEQDDGEDATLCRQLLRFVAVTIEPQKLHSLPALSDFPEDMHTNVQNVSELVDRCGSFLSIRYDDTVHFVHQSAADFFTTGAGTRIFEDGYEDQHRRMAGLCIDLMRETLRKDICDGRHPGIHRTEIDDTVLQRALPEWIQYACCHWLKHSEQGRLLQANTAEPDGKDALHDFLNTHLLYWFEALAWRGRLSEALLGLAYLEATAQTKECGSGALLEYVVDARRFATTNRYNIENAPLQVYASALVFSPQQSSTRRKFEKYMPRWLRRLPLVPRGWGACRNIFEGHLSSVTSIVFSPDGRLVASGSHDRTVRLWDATSGEARGTLEGHSSLVSTVVFSPDSTLVASGSDDRTVRLWDATSGEARGTLEGHSDWVRSVVFSPDGKLVASGSDDKTVRLWDATSGEARGTLEGHSSWVRSVVFSPDGKLVASGSDDKTVRLWDATSGEARGTLEGHSDLVNTVVFSPDGKLVASGSSDNTVRLWDATSGEARGTLEGHSGRVSTVVFSPDGKLVASGSHDCTVRLWDATSGEARGTLEGHSSGVRSVVFSPDGKLVASGSDDRTVRLWDATSGEARGTLEGYSSRITSLVFSPDSKLLFVNGRAWSVQDMDTANAQSSRLLPSPKPFSTAQRCWVDQSRQWITVDDMRVLWLPPDVRPGTFDVRDDTIAIGNGSGRVTFIHIDNDPLNTSRLVT